MNHANPRGAHMRHAARAGGFPGGLGITFPGFGDPGTTASPTASIPSIGLSLGLSIPLDTSSALPSSTSAAVSSSSALPSSSTTSALPSTTTSSATKSSVSITKTVSGTALGDLTKVVTQTNIATAQDAAASSSSTAPASTSALVAPVLGGVGGGILGLALLIFLVTFFMRRRRKDDEAINFDPGSFRRSAMLLSDPPTHQDVVARGYNGGSSPQMVETAPAYMTRQRSYDMSPGFTPNSGNPLVFEAPFSPISPGMTASPVALYDHNIMAGAAPPILTRNTSSSSSHSSHHAPAAQYAQYPSVPAATGRQLAPEYVDMERTSVTPYQAAQYAEISARLQTEVPKGLDTPQVEEFVNTMPTTPIKDSDLPPVPQDPFSDEHQHEGEEDEESLPAVQDLSFPAPPSPAATSVSRYRVESLPPSLPEIVVESRVSVAAFSDSDTPTASGFPSGQTLVIKGAESPMGSSFPVTPSPLASSFTVTPPASQTSFPAAPERAATKTTRPETVYDPEDAYGGM